MSAAVRAMGAELATVTSAVGRVFSGTGLEQAAARRTRTAVTAPHPARRTGLLLFFFLRVFVAGIDDQRLFNGLGLIARLGTRALGRLFLGLVCVLVAFLIRIPPEAEEVALDVRPLLRLGRAVMPREGDPAGVLDALQDLTNGNARVAIREVLQSVENSSRISFPGHHRPAETKERAYIKGNFFRFGRDADEEGDEDTDETEEETTEGSGAETGDETETVEEPLVVDTGDEDAEEEEEE